MPSSDISWPRKMTLLVPNKHLDPLIFKFAAITSLKTFSKRSRCSAQVLVAMQMSSIKTCRSRPLSPARRIFIIFLKDAGALVRPNGILLNWNNPSSVRNAVNSFDLGSIQICQKPDAKSIWLNIFLPAMESKQSSIFGKGYTDFLVKSVVLSICHDRIAQPYLRGCLPGSRDDV